MTYKDILKLKEGAHVVTVNTERCLVVRLREGYTLTTLIPGKQMLIQRYSERGHGRRLSVAQAGVCHCQAGREGLPNGPEPDSRQSDDRHPS